MNMQGMFNPFNSSTSGGGGGGGGGFTPTERQLDAMNSGITADDVLQISINATNITNLQLSITDINSDIEELRQLIGDINAVLEEVL